MSTPLARVKFLIHFEFIKRDDQDGHDLNKVNDPDNDVESFNFEYCPNHN